MTEIGYMKMEEVPGIPRLPRTPGAVVYAPLWETCQWIRTSCSSRARPADVMLLHEAAARGGGAGCRSSAVPRAWRCPPRCSGAVASVGCIGNRVYTDVGEDELYVVVPGRDLVRVAAEAETIAGANAKLSEYHRGRRASLATE